MMIDLGTTQIGTHLEKMGKGLVNSICSKSPLANLFICAAAGAVDRLSAYVPVPQGVGVKQLDTETVAIASFCSVFSLSTLFHLGAFQSLPQTIATLSVAGVAALTTVEAQSRFYKALEREIP